MRNVFATSMLVFCWCFCLAQKQAWPLKISVLDESISVPNFWFTQYQFNPCLNIGTEFSLKQNEKSDFHLSGDLGFYHHKYWQNALYLDIGFGYRKAFWKMDAALRLGAGYHQVFIAGPTYEYEEGKYQEVRSFGSPKLAPFLGLEVNYYFSDKVSSPSLFLTFKGSAEIGPIPIPHQFVGLGFKCFPFSEKLNK